MCCVHVQALERSGMSYCIVRPGGMERPKDDYKESHNLVIKPRDTIFGGQVGCELHQAHVSHT
jgi:hypothetical protein